MAEPTCHSKGCVFCHRSLRDMCPRLGVRYSTACLAISANRLARGPTAKTRGGRREAAPLCFVGERAFAKHEVAQFALLALIAQFAIIAKHDVG